MTWATQMETVAFAAAMFNRLEVHTSTASTGLLDAIDDLRGDIVGERATDAHDAIGDFRSLIAQALDPGQVQSVMDPLLRQVAEDITTSPNPDGDLAQVWEDLYDYAHTNSHSVESSFASAGASLGTPSAGGGNTGNGDVVRVTVDENGYTLDGWFSDDYTLTCIEDARELGSVGQEVFRLEGEAAARDGLSLAGSGLDELITSMDSRTAQALIRNPSFDASTSTAAVGTPASPTALDGWTVAGSLSNLQIDLDTYYIATPGAPRNAGLRFTANETISQDLVAINGARFDPDVPYVVGFAMRRENSATGTMTATLGGVSRAITIGSQSDDAWTWFWLVSSPGQNNWFKNFNGNSLTLTFALTSLAVDQIVIDHIVAGPMTRVGRFGDPRTGRGSMGQYIAIRSGTTPWVRDDVFTWTDDGEPTTRATNSYWFRRGALGYLPNRADATQVTASGGRTLTFTNSTSTITASSGDFASDGYYAGMTLTVAGTSNNNGSFTISSVTATTIVTVEALTDEGPLSSTATLDAAPSVADKT